MFGEAAARRSRGDGPSFRYPAVSCDALAAFVLRGTLLFPSVRKRVEALETALFASRAERVLAGMILVDMWTVPELPPAAQREFDELSRIVADSAVPDSEEWAHHLVTVLAQRRSGPLLAEVCQWSADRLRAGSLPGPWVLRKLHETLALITPPSITTPTTQYEEAFA